MAFLLLLGFAVASAYAYHRWRTRGIALLCVALAAVDVVRGTVAWMLPHTDTGIPRPWDWPCHATGTLMPVAILGSGVALALYATRHRFGSLEERLVISGLTCMLLTLPVIFVMVWWGVTVLGCDTL